MFPTNTKERPKGNCHYGWKNEKVNDMVAFRSKDKGKTWHGPTMAFDIDYNQHGFIPLIPKIANGSMPLALNHSGVCGLLREGKARTHPSDTATQTMMVTIGVKSGLFVR